MRRSHLFQRGHGGFRSRLLNVSHSSVQQHDRENRRASYGSAVPFIKPQAGRDRRRYQARSRAHPGTGPGTSSTRVPALPRRVRSSRSVPVAPVTPDRSSHYARCWQAGRSFLSLAADRALHHGVTCIVFFLASDFPTNATPRVLPACQTVVLCRRVRCPAFLLVHHNDELTRIAQWTQREWVPLHIRPQSR